MVTHSLTYTGAPLVAIDLAIYLSYYYDVILINMNSEVPILKRRNVPSKIKTVDVPYWLENPKLLVQIINKFISICTKKKLSMRKLWFYFLLKIKNPEIILFNTLYHADIQHASNILNKRSIRYLHENYHYLKNLPQTDIDIINQGGKVIACSPTVLRDTLKVGLKCDPEFFPAATDRVLEILDKKSVFSKSNQKKRTILTVGSGWEIKGGEYAEEFASSNPEVVFHWIGEITSPNLFKTVKYHGLQKVVDFNIAESFFLLSKVDAWPIAAMEALAHGLVVFGWSHLALIQELEKDGLAVAVESFNIKELNTAYYDYNFSLHHLKKNTAKVFLEKYHSKYQYTKIFNIAT